MQILKLLIAIAVVFQLVTCKKSTNNSDEGSPKEGTISIKAEDGGEVISVDGRVKMNIPAGALENDADILIEPFSLDSLHSDWKESLSDNVITAWKMEPDGLEFDSLVTVTFRVALADVPKDTTTGGKQLFGIISRSSTGKFEVLPGSLGKVSNDSISIEVLVKHFSVFGALKLGSVKLSTSCDVCNVAQEESFTSILSNELFGIHLNIIDWEMGFPADPIKITNPDNSEDLDFAQVLIDGNSDVIRALQDRSMGGNFICTKPGTGTFFVRAAIAEPLTNEGKEKLKKIRLQTGIDSTTTFSKQIQCVQPPLQCDSGKVEKDSVCICDSGTVDDGNGICIDEPIICDSGKTLVDTVCVCDSGTVDDGNGGCKIEVIPKCDSGKVEIDSICVCDTGTVDDGNGDCKKSSGDFAVTHNITLHGDSGCGLNETRVLHDTNRLEIIDFGNADFKLNPGSTNEASAQDPQFLGEAGICTLTVITDSASAKIFDLGCSGTNACHEKFTDVAPPECPPGKIKMDTVCVCDTGTVDDGNGGCQKSAGDFAQAHNITLHGDSGCGLNETRVLHDTNRLEIIDFGNADFRLNPGSTNEASVQDPQFLGEAGICTLTVITDSASAKIFDLGCSGTNGCHEQFTDVAPPECPPGKIKKDTVCVCDTGTVADGNGGCNKSAGEFAVAHNITLHGDSGCGLNETRVLHDTNRAEIIDFGNADFRLNPGSSNEASVQDPQFLNGSGICTLTVRIDTSSAKIFDLGCTGPNACQESFTDVAPPECPPGKIKKDTVCVCDTGTVDDGNGGCKKSVGLIEPLTMKTLFGDGGCGLTTTSIPLDTGNRDVAELSGGQFRLDPGSTTDASASNVTINGGGGNTCSLKLDTNTSPRKLNVACTGPNACTETLTDVAPCAAGKVRIDSGGSGPCVCDSGTVDDGNSGCEKSVGDLSQVAMKTIIGDSGCAVNITSIFLDVNKPDIAEFHSTDFKLIPGSRTVAAANDVPFIAGTGNNCTITVDINAVPDKTLNLECSGPGSCVELFK